MNARIYILSQKQLVLYFFRFIVSLIACSMLLRPAFGKSKQKEFTPWAICMPFIKASNGRGEISDAAVRKVFARFSPPVREEMSPEAAVSIYMRDIVMNYGGMSQHSWETIDSRVNDIYLKNAKINKFRININNYGELETIVEFHYFNYGFAFNFVINDEGVFHPDFHTPDWRVVQGELREFNGKTYLFDIQNSITYTKARRELGFNTQLVIYRPETSAIMNQKGLAIGYHNPACVLKIVD